MKHKNSRPWIAVIAVFLLIGVLIGSAVGKYVKTIPVRGKVTFTASLAEEVLLQEHYAHRQPDGSYKLTGKILPAEDDPATDDVNESKGNTYFLLPGSDVPKDPFITITGKTDVKAYLFVEIVEGQDVGTEENALIRYQMNGSWKKLPGVTGKHGGTVYVFTGGTGTEKELDSGIGASFSTQILASLPGKTETICVSQKLITDGTSTNNLLDFYATLKEIGSAASTAEVYNR